MYKFLKSWHRCVIVHLNSFLAVSTFTIRVSHRQTTFREIKHVCAYDVESLYGDIGGYMGLLLGYSILNLPSMILFCYGSIRKRILDLKPLRSNKNNERRNEIGYSSSHLRIIHGETATPMNAIDDENEWHGEVSYAKYDILFQEFNTRLSSLEDQLK